MSDTKHTVSNIQGGEKPTFRDTVLSTVFTIDDPSILSFAAVAASVSVAYIYYPGRLVQPSFAGLALIRDDCFNFRHYMASPTLIRPVSDAISRTQCSISSAVVTGRRDAAANVALNITAVSPFMMYWFTNPGKKATVLVFH